MEPMITNPTASLSPLWPRWWSRLRQALPAVRVRRTPRQLRLCESLALGEKRLVAVIQYEGQKFLVGGSAHSVNLLARLGEAPDFSELLTEWCERQR
jgi:flagellar biogenesis protein FliO